jgi:hypothetical protein
MNPNRFKELLNLHLDHRLSKDEAHELDQALRSDPVLMRKFRSYMAMQHGCAELFRRSAADAPAPDALVKALRQAEARMQQEPRRRAPIFGWGAWSATAGMAAVVTVIAVRVSQPSLVSVASNDSGAASPTKLASADGSSIRVTNGEPARVVILGPSQALPEHLTLAALGISPERTERPALSRWQQAEDEAIRAEANASETLAWMPGGTAATSPAWSRSSTLAATHFSPRPINAWNGQSGGAQFQNASFTYER